MNLQVQSHLQGTRSPGMCPLSTQMSSGGRRGTVSQFCLKHHMVDFSASELVLKPEAGGPSWFLFDLLLRPLESHCLCSLGLSSPYKLPAWFLRFNQILSKVKIFCLKINSGKTGKRSISDLSPVLIKGGSSSKLLDSCNNNLEYGLMSRRKHTSLDLTLE